MHHIHQVSLPEYFAKHGYATHGMGKIYHPNICDGAAVGEQLAAWTEPYYHAPCISLGSIYNHTCYEQNPMDMNTSLPMNPGGKLFGIYANATAGSAEDMPDGMIAAHAVNELKLLAARQQQQQQQHGAGAGAGAEPFFMAVGFHKPHLPHIAPQEFFDLYPLENISLPDDASRSTPANLPDGAWNGNGEWLTYKDQHANAAAEGLSIHQHLNDTYTQMQRRAYYASASFADAQIGKVLAQLKASGLEQNTVIGLFGDHGCT